MPNKSSAQELAEDIVSLYRIGTDIDALIEKTYSVDARFRDPLVEVSGIQNVRAQILAISCFASRSTATLLRGSMAGNTLAIESEVKYFIKPFPSVIYITLHMFTTCEIQDGKVVEHIDHWDVKSIIQNLPIMGFLYNRFRPGFGAISSAILNKVYTPRKETPKKD